MANASLEYFIAEAEAFLARWPAKQERSAGFEWGRGSDDVAVFDEPDSDTERARLDEVRAWRKAMAEAGLAWITGPPEHGGRGLPWGYQQAFDALARQRDVPGNAPLTISLGMVAPTILAHGTESAKQQYLAAMHAGDIVGCQLFSEPNAGSDLAGVATRAVRDGVGWRLSGQKVWTSGAHLADIGEALCRTSDGARHRNLTVFVVDMQSPGVEVRPLRQMTGGAAFNEVFLDDVWVPDGDRLGDVDGGWRVAMTTLANERGAIGGASFGGKGLLSFDRLKALLRHTGTEDDALTRQRAAALFLGLRTAAWTRQRYAESGSLGAEGALLKLALVRDFQVLSDLVSGCLGPKLTADSGEWGTYAWVDLVLGVPGYRIGGGTDEVLKTMVGERVLGLPKEPVTEGMARKTLVRNNLALDEIG